MSEYRFYSFSDFQIFDNKSENFINLPIEPYQTTRKTNTKHPEELSTELNIPYTVFEILVAIIAIIGNLMVIIVFQKDKKLRRRTNYYIVSLAMADFLVGLLGVPFAILASVGLPTNLHACLFTVSLLVVLCTISIFCLVAVSVDRYWAILYPMAYSRNVRTKTAIGIISMCWLAGSFVGFLPLFGWHANVKENQACLFVEVMDYNYLVFLYFATIITPALLLLAFYAHIYRVIVKQVRQRSTMTPIGDSYSSRRFSALQLRGNPNRPHGGTMLRVLGAARKRDVKATQNLSIIVLFFMICWIPLYTINCIKAFCPQCYVHPKLTFFCIILSHLNSAVNPVLYAYHLKDFRAALKNLILKIVGIEVEQPNDLHYRFSLASQHRLQSLIDKRTSLQNRIYIDSPVWLRQQQKQELTMQSPITCSLNSVHQTVAAVASSTAEINRDMWNIVEVPSCAENNSRYNQDDEDSIDDSPSDRQNHNNSEQDCSQFSYENKNYSSSLNDLEDDEVFLPSDNKVLTNQQQKLHSLSSYMRERLKTDEQDYLKRFNNKKIPISDSFQDYEIIPHNNSMPPKSTDSNKTFIVSQQDETMNKTQNSIYTLENDKNPLSPAHKTRIMKSSKVIHSSFGEKVASSLRITKSCSSQIDGDAKSNSERFSPLKTVSNLIFQSAKTSSLFQISENCSEGNGVRKRTTSDS